MPPVQCRPADGRGQHVPLLYLLLLFLSIGRIDGYIHIPHDYKYDDIKQLPKITNLAMSQTVFSLDDVNLACEASGDPIPSIRWVKDGNQFVKDQQGSSTLTANKTEDLRFYQGTYRCYAANELGTAVSDLVHLTTEAVPTLPKEKGQKQQQFEEGVSTVLFCNPPKSSVIPKIHWMDSQWRHIQQSERVTTSLDGNLYFANLLQSDSRDDYTCNAHYINASIILPKEPISISIFPSNSVVKNRRPRIIYPAETHSTYLILKGQTLTLECIPEGLPTPEVHWKMKDGPLSTRATILNYGRWLQIVNVSETVDGEYVCTARNSQGSVTHSYIVTVEAAPYWTKKPEEHLYAPGETVKLDCHAEGIPTPNITWSINGVPLSGTDLEPRRSVISGTLILREVRYSDTAVYQCQATNKHATILLNTHVHVVELPPQILTVDGIMYRKTTGSTVIFECRTFGSPRPKVDWKNFDSSPAMSNAKMSQMANGNLQISNVSQEESGVYMCLVRDSNVTISAVLDVFNRTKIVAPPQHLRVVRGNDVVLQCKYSVDHQLKEPTIQWKKDGHKITASANDDKYTEYPNGSLKVTDVQIQDSGVYGCEISTELDSDSASGSITVQDKPGAPLSVEMSEKRERSVTLTWTSGDENNSPVFEYIIEMKEEQCTDASTWREYERVHQDIKRIEIHLQPFCKYHFRVRAVNEIGNSEPSSESESYITPAAKPDMNPENVTSVSTDPNSMIITWKELDRREFNGKGFKYKVSWRQSLGRGPDFKHSIVSGPPFIVNDTGTFVPFEIKVLAVNDEGTGPEPVAKLGYSGEDVPLEAPSGVTVEELPSNKTIIRVRWSPVSRESVRGHLLGYKIHLIRKGPRTHFHKRLENRWLAVNNRERERDEKKRVLNVYGNKDEEVVSDLQFYSNYTLTVTAFNGKGEGPHSDPHHFSTPEGAPGPISDLYFESLTGTQITLRWPTPHKPNGVITGYLLTYHEIVDGNSSPRQVVSNDLPAVTEYTLENLDPQSRYQFTLRARNSAGVGEPIIREGATMLDGEPPSVINMTVGETSVNLSWVPGERHRNFAFSFRYLRKVSGGDWEESEPVNSTQAFYQLQGLEPGTRYHLQIRSGNTSYDWDFQTKGPELEELASGFATQGWFIGLISAVVLILLVLLILCFIKRSKGGKYSVKDKEEGQAESGARPLKDDAFGEYRSLESDNEEKRSVSQPSVCESKRSSNDSLADYGDSVDIQFNEDGSFIGQYSGRRDAQGHAGHESSGATSPMNPNMPPPSISFPNSVTGILGPN